MSSANSSHSTPSAVSRRITGWAWAFGAAGLLCHGAHLLYLAGSQGCDSVGLLCPTGETPWVAGDYPSYFAVAESIRQEGIWGASYMHRAPGFPLLIVLAEALAGTANPLRWLGPVGAGLAAAGVVQLAGALSAGLRAALAAGALFLVWPSSYRYSAALQTDGLHAFAIVAGLALLWSWRKRERQRDAALGVTAFLVAQLLRPTLFPLPLLIPVLLWKRDASRRYVGRSLGVVLATALVPAFVVASNAIHHGVATPGHVMAVNLGCYSVPRLQEERGRGTFQQLRLQCLRKYRGWPPAERIPAQYAEALPLLAERPLQTARSFGRELRDQMLHPLVFHDVRRRATLYPRWADSGRGFLLAFWLASLASWLWLRRREPALAIFVALCAASIVIPATTSHWVGDRLRFPVDLLAMPLVACGFDAALRALRSRELRQSFSRPSQPSDSTNSAIRAPTKAVPSVR